MVAQEYTSRVHDEDVLKGNSAILKCVIPSFVADFVSVQSWVDGEGRVYYPSGDYGNESHVISLSFFYSLFISCLPRPGVCCGITLCFLHSDTKNSVSSRYLVSWLEAVRINFVTVFATGAVHSNLHSHFFIITMTDLSPQWCLRAT